MYPVISTEVKVIADSSSEATKIHIFTDLELPGTKTSFWAQKKSVSIILGFSKFQTYAGKLIHYC